MTQCSIAGHLLLSTREGPADKMWALGGEFIRDLHSDSSLRKEASGVGSSPDNRVRRAPSSITAAKISRDPSIPRAASSTSSLPRRLADACRHPQIPPRRHKLVKDNRFTYSVMRDLVVND